MRWQKIQSSTVRCANPQEPVFKLLNRFLSNANSFWVVILICKAHLSYFLKGMLLIFGLFIYLSRIFLWLHEIEQ